MKRLSLILAFLFYATISYAQSYEVNIQAVANKKIYNISSVPQQISLSYAQFIIRN